MEREREGERERETGRERKRERERGREGGREGEYRLTINSCLYTTAGDGFIRRTHWRQLKTEGRTSTEHSIS